tara:strand:- start:1076 stop:1315 length:240 start_codon:yes stop_codon:yes gene_type:complete
MSDKTRPPLTEAQRANLHKIIKEAEAALDEMRGWPWPARRIPEEDAVGAIRHARSALEYDKRRAAREDTGAVTGKCFAC